MSFITNITSFFIEPEEDQLSFVQEPAPGLAAPEVPAEKISALSPVEQSMIPAASLSSSGAGIPPCNKPKKGFINKRVTSFFTDDEDEEFITNPVTASPPENTTVSNIAVEAMPVRQSPEGLPHDTSAVEEKTPLSPSVIQKFLSLFRKHEQQDITTLVFDHGELGLPSLEGSLKDVNLTYGVEPPYQYVHIGFSPAEGTMIYSVVEPQLSVDEKSALTIIENAFEKLVSTNAALVDAEQREKYLHERFYSLIDIFGLKVNTNQKARMYFHLRKQYLGYGRIDTLMKDKFIEDISCNGSDMYLYVQHRTYGSVRTDVKFGEVELNNFVLRLAQVSGRHVSLLQPIRDLTLPDGSRANITLGGEVTKKGSTFTIRKFRANPISSIELMEYGSIDAKQLAFLWILMEYKRSILVSGGTATGKTTFLNVLCSFIPPEYKIVSIEDTAELNLMHPNWIQSITRTGFGSSDSVAGGVSGIGGGGGGGKSPGDISLYDLLVAALRQRPEFIIVGEVRGGEAFTLSRLSPSVMQHWERSTPAQWTNCLPVWSPTR